VTAATGGELRLDDRLTGVAIGTLDPSDRNGNDCIMKVHPAHECSRHTPLKGERHER